MEPDQQLPAARGVPAIAAILSFLWPGLGQGYRGRRKSALLFGIPVLVLAIAGLYLLISLGVAVAIAYLFNPVVAIGMLAVVACLGLWRAIATVDAARNRRGYAPASSSQRRAANGLVVLLILAIVVSHGWVGYTLVAFGRAGAAIYDPGETPVAAQAPSPSSAPGASAAPVPGSTAPNSPAPATPMPTAAPLLPGDDGRMTVLLVGIDNTHGTEFGLTDTLIVASLDQATRSLTMISIPRDTARLPLYLGGTYGPRINTLMRAARRNPDTYPDGPLATVVREVEFLVGVRIDYSAQINIAGFTQLVDAVGGVDVVLERAINDPTYGFSPTEIGFHLEPGPHHLIGKYAIAYARSRHGPGNNDYVRAQRQQQLLLALRNKLNDPLVLTNLPGVVDAFAQVLRTDAPLDRLPELVGIAQQSGSATSRHIVLNPPRYARQVVNAQGQRTFATELRMDEVAALSRELFGDDSLYPTEAAESAESAEAP